MTAPTEHDRQECERLARRVASLRRAHDRRPESVAVVVSLVAFHRWGTRPPASFLDKHRGAAVFFPGSPPHPTE